jgi:hypothetical protein
VGRRVWDRYGLHADAFKALDVVDKVFGDDNVDDGLRPENEDRDLVVAENRVNVRPRRKFHYASRVALLAKAQVGLMSHSKANELVYQRLCRDEMLKHGVRHTHIARLLPLAVAACFVRTDEDTIAESMREILEREDKPSIGDRLLGKWSRPKRGAGFLKK